jgi:subtilase family serine protease
VRLQLTNSGDAPIQSPVGIQLVASSDTTLDAGDAPVTNVTRPVRLQPGRSRFLVVPFAYPTVADGQYFILANLDSANGIAEGNEGNNVAASAAPVLIAEPFVDLVATVGAPPRGSFTIGRRTSVPITVTNNGNVPASGLLQIDVFASADAARGTDDSPLASLTRRVRIRNARSRIIRVGFIFPAELLAGSYFVTTTIDAPNAIAESNETNNDAASSVAFTAA